MTTYDFLQFSSNLYGSDAKKQGAYHERAEQSS